MSYKTIQDTVHGSVKFEGAFLELLDTPEIQRLHGINQLGLTKLVFPGANHTRLEHSIGTYHVADRMSRSLDLDVEEKDIVKTAALLHDVGHAPYSHTLESILENETGKDHMDITKDIIVGDLIIEERETPSIPEILEKHGISPNKVADLIKGKSERTKLKDFNTHKGQKYFGEERYLYQMIHGPMDVDQLDYLLRDSHYTGAVHGVIDIERVLQTIEIHNGDLVISKGGVPAVEGILVSRGLMFSSVYLHKTARIAELMLSKAVYNVKDNLESIYRMTDWELMSFLRDQGDFAEEVVNRIKYRYLYKRCLSLDQNEIGNAKMIDMDKIGTLKEIRKLEKRIAKKRNFSENKVIVDVPHEELKLSEPRLARTSVKILEEGRLYNLSRYSPLAYALQKRPTQPWVLMVSCPEDLREELGDIAKKEIMG